MGRLWAETQRVTKKLIVKNVHKPGQPKALSELLPLISILQQCALVFERKGPTNVTFFNKSWPSYLATRFVEAVVLQKFSAQMMNRRANSPQQNSVVSMRIISSKSSPRFQEEHFQKNLGKQYFFNTPTIQSDVYSCELHMKVLKVTFR
jgi:hypothetical protein